MLEHQALNVELDVQERGEDEGGVEPVVRPLPVLWPPGLPLHQEGQAQLQEAAHTGGPQHGGIQCQARQKRY
jgi:hypothetical protein